MSKDRGTELNEVYFKFPIGKTESKAQLNNSRLAYLRPLRGVMKVIYLEFIIGFGIQ
jgi:hypothetical protein